MLVCVDACSVYLYLNACRCSAVLCVFFFKQKTAYYMRISDWSSDVCSSDLLPPLMPSRAWRRHCRGCSGWSRKTPSSSGREPSARHGSRSAGASASPGRSEERRVGKACVSVDLGGRRLIKKQKPTDYTSSRYTSI